MWELGCEESWVLKNWCFWTVVLEKTLESPLDCKEIQPVHPKGDQSWMFIGRTDVEAETPILWPHHAELIHWQRSWCLERLRAGGEGDNRGSDGWMTSPTQRRWVWVDSRSWWWTGRPGVLWFMRLQRVRHDWATELNWTEQNKIVLQPSPTGTLYSTFYFLTFSLSYIYFHYLDFASFITSWSWLPLSIIISQRPIKSLLYVPQR